MARLIRPRRILVAAVALTALICDLAAAAPPAQAADAAQARTSAHLAVSLRTVASGGTVRITGSLDARGSGLRHALVRVQQRVHGTAEWATLARRRTDGAGRISVRSHALRSSHDFRLVYAGGPVTSASASRPVGVRAQQAVAITRVSDLHPMAGDIVTISGRAGAGIRDRRAALQLSTAHGWKSVATTRVPTSGSFTITVRSMRGGQQRYRLRVVGGPGVATAVSFPTTFDVSAWYRLIDQTPLASTSFFGGAQSIGGTVFDDSVSVALTARTGAYVDYRLGYGCRLLRTTLGPADGSSADFSARFTAKVDDARPIDMVLSQGSDWSETAEISGGHRLRLSAFAVAGDGTAAWGDAEVLCVGRP